MNVSSERLVTEELRSQFGDIVLEVTEQDDVRRIGCLRRARDKAVLTYHIATFYPKGVAALGAHHLVIVAGKPLGETVKHSGVPHTRHVSATEAALMPPFMRALFRTNKRKCLAQQIDYTVRGKRYVHIKEFYNPEFVSLRTGSRVSLSN